MPPDLDALFVDEVLPVDFDVLRDVEPLLFVLDFVELFVEEPDDLAAVFDVEADEVLTFEDVVADFAVMEPTLVAVVALLPVLVALFVVDDVVVPVRVVTPLLLVLVRPVVVEAFFDVAADVVPFCFVAVCVLACVDVEEMRDVEEFSGFEVLVALLPLVVPFDFVTVRFVEPLPLELLPLGEKVLLTPLLLCCVVVLRLPPIFTVVRVLLSRLPCCPPPMVACVL